jgi:hypothetical protein
LRQTPKTAATTTYQPRSPTVVSRAYYNDLRALQEGLSTRQLNNCRITEAIPQEEEEESEWCTVTGIPRHLRSRIFSVEKTEKVITDHYKGKIPQDRHTNEVAGYFNKPIRHSNSPQDPAFWAEQERQVRTGVYDRSLRTHAVAFLRVQAASRLEPRQPLYHPYRRPQPKKAASYRDPVRKPSARPHPADLPPYQEQAAANVPPPAPRPNNRLPLPDVGASDPVPAYEQEQLPVSNKETTKHRRQDLDDLAAAAFQQHRLNKYNSADAPLRLECVEEIKQKYPEWY